MRPTTARSAALGIVLFFSCVALASAARPEPSSRRWEEKVEPRVLSAALVGRTEFLIYLAEQADLSGAYRLGTKVEKGRYVYERLTAVASDTQPAITRELDRLGDSITYFYVMSNIGGTGDVYIDGLFRETLSYGANQQGSENPTFGHKRTFSGLGGGTHELKVEHRTGAVYVDGFGFACEERSSADPLAPLFGSATSASAASAGEGPVIERAVTVGANDVDLSLVVEGASVPLTTRLLGPAGELLATGGALIQGLSASGLDAPLSGPGLYRVQVVAVPGTFQTLQISVARTVRVK
jgi:hypothetical protein